MNIMDEFIEEIKAFGIGRLVIKSGVSKSTIEKWVYYGNIPSLEMAQKVLNAIGLELQIVEK